MGIFRKKKTPAHVVRPPKRQQRTYAASGAWGADAWQVTVVDNRTVELRLDIFEELVALAGYKRYPDEIE